MILRSILPHLVLLLFPAPLMAQQLVQAPTPPQIEVTGRSEVRVVPDEIHIAIDLSERGSGNSKVTVDKQELDLKEAVKGLGIDAGNLTLSDAMADLVPKKFRDDDVIARKGYMLKVSDAEMVRKVFLELDRLQIEDARIHHVSHSREVELRREQRIKAMQDAKEQADQLLEAIGERTGPALEVRESRGVDRIPAVQGQSQSLFGAARGGDPDYEEMGVGFSRITIRASVYAKFGIAAR